MTGAQLYTYCMGILKRTDKETDFYQAATDVVMDMRLRFHAEDFKTISSELTISTLGDYSTEFPSDLGHLIGDPILRDSASDQEYNPPKKISIEKYNELYGDRYNSNVGNRTTGTPIHYCKFGNLLLVGPAVDKTTYKFRVTYTTEDAAAITSATSIVPFSERYRKTVRYGIMREMMVVLENFEEASNWATLYEQDLLKIIANDTANAKDGGSIAYNGV